MVKLSKRMRMSASMVMSHGILADVGTDHGYVPIALLKEQKIKGAIAMDINKGPLARAKEHVAAAGLEEYIQTRLSDGVLALKPGEADSILIAGMGGELMLHILSEGKDVCDNAQELILQPQSEIHRVREYLRENQYRIVDEDMVLEDEKYYTAIRTVRDTSGESLVCGASPQPIEDRYGPVLLQKAHPVLKMYLDLQHTRLTQILNGLKAQPESEKISTRMAEIKEKLKWNEEAFHIVEGDNREWNLS